MNMIEAARSYVGTPFRHQGRIPGKGLDCVGLLVCAARQAGVDVVDEAGYSMTPSADLLRQAVERNNVTLVSEPQPGDVLVMRFSQEPQHLALYTERDTIIHAYLDIGKVCEHRYADVWRARTVAVYRLNHG